VLGAVAVLAIAGHANAGPEIIKGGPARDADRQQLERALGQVAGSLAVCWRGKRAAAVKVQLSVGADGAVAKAKAMTSGKVAKCAAAVLAVQTLARAKRGYRATVTFPTRGGGGGGGDREAIQKGVRTNSSVAACYRDKPALKGELQLRFLVKPNGRIMDVEIAKSTLSDGGVARCLVKAVAAIRLGKLSMRKTVEFVLPFRFDGRAGRAGSADKALRPQKTGPLAADALTEAMNDARAKFSACYDAQAKKEPSLAGDVVLRYTVRADGKPYNVKIKRSTLDNAAVEKCMVRVGKKLRFPARAGRKPTKVIYPFRFAPAP
jgi:TonB family protein